MSQKEEKRGHGPSHKLHIVARGTLCPPAVLPLGWDGLAYGVAHNVGVGPSPRGPSQVFFATPAWAVGHDVFHRLRIPWSSLSNFLGDIIGWPMAVAVCSDVDCWLPLGTCVSILDFCLLWQFCWSSGVRGIFGMFKSRECPGDE